MSSNIRRCGPSPQSPKRSTPPLRKAWGERLTRNAAIATLLLLTVVGIRESTNSGSFLHAIQTAVESEWDQNVGRLTYVSNTLADTVQVFGQKSADIRLTSPVSVQAVQAWTRETPYLLFQQAGNVFAAAPGEVAEIAHDDNSYYIIRLIHDNGLNSLYFGLKSCAVSEGQAVTVDTLLGVAGPELAFSVQRNGKDLNCETLLSLRGTAQ